MRWTHWLALGFGSLVLLSGCATIGDHVPSQEKKVFYRIGGKPYLMAIVDDLMVRLEVNHRLQRFFAPSDRPGWHARIFSHLCVASGGPCETGQGMTSTSQRLGMTSTDFDVMLAEFVVTLDKFHIAESEKHALRGFLEPLRQEMVQH